jgi:quinol monooxygenase YgiN
MYVVSVEFITRPEHFEDFVSRVRQQAADSLEFEPDCHLFDVCVDPERNDFVYLYEIYSDKTAFDEHLASAHFRDFDATVSDWISDKKVTILQKLKHLQGRTSATY